MFIQNNFQGLQTRYFSNAFTIPLNMYLQFCLFCISYCGGLWILLFIQLNGLYRNMPVFLEDNLLILEHKISFGFLSYPSGVLVYKNHLLGDRSLTPRLSCQWSVTPRLMKHVMKYKRNEVLCSYNNESSLFIHFSFAEDGWCSGGNLIYFHCIWIKHVEIE